MNLSICIPTRGVWQSQFGMSIALTMSNLTQWDRIDRLRIMQCEATIIPAGRNDLARDAVGAGASQLLWCDDDMQFSPDQVRALLQHDADVVGVSYKKRQAPHDWIAKDLDGKPVGVDGKGLVPVSQIGFGLVAMKADVLKRVPEPWFACPWIEEDNDFCGEDIFFCHKARAHGVEVMCDTGIRVGHVGKAIV